MPNSTTAASSSVSSRSSVSGNPYSLFRLPLRLQDAEPRAQQRRQNFFRGGLADRAGDRRDAPPGRAFAESHARAPALQRGERVVDGEEPAANFGAGSRQTARSPRRGRERREQSVPDEIVSIVSRAAYGDEQLSVPTVRESIETPASRARGSSPGEAATPRASAT